MDRGAKGVFSLRLNTESSGAESAAS